MPAIRTTVIALCCVLQAGTACAFGPRGHQYAGAVADALLKPHARSQVDQRLGMSLRTAATWADCVKDVTRGADGVFRYVPDAGFHAACAAFETTVGKSRMLEYVRRNWATCHDAAATKGCHALYHFADVAIQHDRYDRTFAGTSDHDIVSAIDAAVARLQDKPVPAPFSIKDKAEALLMLAHLVGDIHQPLHVGSVYIDAHDQPVDPGASGGPHDPTIDTRGGNRLEDGPTNLHADWDGTGWLDPMNVSKTVLAEARAVPPTDGAITGWPAAWASQSVQTAKQAFSGLHFTRQGAARTGDWVVRFDDRAAYLKAKGDLQTHQLAKAGARLAQLLNAVWP